MARVHPDHRINVAIAYSTIQLLFNKWVYFDSKHPHIEGHSYNTHTAGPLTVYMVRELRNYLDPFQYGDLRMPYASTAELP